MPSFCCLLRTEENRKKLPVKGEALQWHISAAFARYTSEVLILQNYPCPLCECGLKQQMGKWFLSHDSEVSACVGFPQRSIDSYWSLKIRCVHQQPHNERFTLKCLGDYKRFEQDVQSSFQPTAKLIYTKWILSSSIKSLKLLSSSFYSLFVYWIAFEALSY